MNCKNVQSRMSAYVDRELSGAEMHEMRDHLGRCEGCRQEEVEARSLKHLLSGVGPVEPPIGFEERLVLNVLKECPVAQLEPRRRPAFLLAAFAAAAAMAGTLLILPMFRTVQPPQPEVKTSISNDYALEINRDQLYEASGDPLSGGHLATPAVYGH